MGSAAPRWSDEEIAEVRRLAARGANVVAARVGRGPKAVRSIAALHGIELAPVNGGPGRHRRASGAEGPALAADPLPARSAAAFDVANRPAGATLQRWADLGPGQCQWIFEGEGRGQGPACGAPTGSHRAWCEHHARLAYRRGGEGDDSDE